MTIEEFIASNPDPRELKRVLAVKMRLEGMKHKEIQPVLGVASSYISRWQTCYQEHGVSGLRLAHKGSTGYLSEAQRAAIICWIQQKSQRTLWELIDYVEQEYQVLYRSLESYYTLFKAAGMSWHKGKKSPKYDESVVRERTEAINAWLAAHSDDIHAGRIKVYAVDECHAKGGDLCGYGWGNRQGRREVEVDNYQDSQTYFGALDCLNETMLLKSAKTANSHSTLEFVKSLQAHSDEAKIVLIWDGASYHCSQAFREYLNEVNQGQEWKIHCLRFAPYAPEENPIENIWGQAKAILKHMHQCCRSFKITKRLFELFINYRLFTMPNLKTYDAFSAIS